MTNSGIETAFRTELESLTLYIKDDNVAWPNEAFSRPESGGWYEVDHLPGTPIQAALGEGSPNRWVGIYQITICIPLNFGKDMINARYDAIAEHFKRGTVISGIEIERVYCGPDDTESDHYRLPVRIEYRADIEN